MFDNILMLMIYVVVDTTHDYSVEHRGAPVLATIFYILFIDGLATVFVLNGWQDLRFDDRARKELLLRTEEFRSKLWFDVEERKAQATAVLRTIKADGRFGFHIFSTVSTAVH